MARFTKELQFNQQARESLIKGINILADAVSTTLGPRGQNVAVDIYPDMDIPPTVLHDGVSVAKSINLENSFEDMGARLLKDASLKTNETAGDGTTTSTIIAQSIVNEAHKAVSSGVNPMQLKQEIEEAAKSVVTSLSKLATKVTSEKEKEQIATISSADSQIGKLVAEAIKKTGDDGMVTIEEGSTTETVVDYKQGLEIDRGYLSNYFITDQARSEAVIEDPYIFLTDKKINYAYQLIPLFEKLAAQAKSKNLVIVAAEVVDEGLAVLNVNKLQGNLNCVAVLAPSFGIRRADELADIAVLINATPLYEESGRDFDSIEIKDLGRADKFIAQRDKSIVINGKGRAKAIVERADALRAQVKNANTQYEKEIKNQRLAKLSGTVAVIKVGGTTEVELKERKERVIDALSATRAAISEGIVAGGEITLLNLASQASVKTLGGRILNTALMSPFKKLLSNAGLDYANFALVKYPYGIDVTDGTVKDMIKEGIIDPVKVTRCALENAVSVACMIITTQVLVTDITPKGEQPL